MKRVFQLYERGLYDFVSCCKACGVGPTQAYKWMKKHPKLKEMQLESMKKHIEANKETMGELAMKAAIRKLNGALVRRVRHFKDGDEIKEVVYFEQLVPDTDLIKFALTNWQPREFRNSQHLDQDVNHTIEIIEEQYIPPKTINIDHTEQ